MNNTNQYLDFYGLHRYDEKLKKYVDDKTKIDNRSITRNSSGELQITQELKEKIENLKLSYGGLITPETDISTLNSSNWYFTDPYHPGTYEWINVNSAGRNRQESITTLPNSAYFFYPKEQSYFMGDFGGTHLNWEYICLNQGTELSSIFKINMISGVISGVSTIMGSNDSININSTDIHLLPCNIYTNSSYINGVLEINMSTSTGAIIRNGKSILNSGQISSDYIQSHNQLVVGTSPIQRYTPGINMTPEKIEFVRTSSGTIDYVSNINMSSGTISGVSNINLEENSNISGVNNVSLASNSGLVLKYNGIKAFTGEVSSAEVSVENTLRIRTGYNNKGEILEKIVFDTPNTGVLDMNGGTITGINQIKIGTGTGIVIDSNTIGMSNYSGEISFLSNIRLTTGGTLNISQGYITGVNQLNITNGILEIKEEVTDVTGSSRALHFINNSGNSNSIVIHKSGIVAGSDYVNGSSIDHFGEGVHFASKVYLCSGFTAAGNIWISGRTSGDTSLINIDNIITERLSLTGSSEFNVNSGTISGLGTLNMVSGGDINMNNSTMKSGNIINSTIINNIYDGTNNTFTNDFINQLKIALGIN